MSEECADTAEIDTTEMKKTALLPVCSFCGQVPEQGIKDIMKLGKTWLCQNCEHKIMKLKVDSPDYGIMLERIKRAWK